MQCNSSSTKGGVLLIIFSVIMRKMLEKKTKNIYFDAHFHSVLCEYSENDNFSGCTCALSEYEWNEQIKYKKSLLMAYGIHPQLIDEKSKRKNLDFLSNLAYENQLSAIGEIGFDFYDDKMHLTENIQKEIFMEQINIAVHYNLPVIIHCRKANDLLFKYSKELTRLPAVQFHSFMGSAADAASLLKRDINGFFSFGKQIFNNNKKVIDCVQKISMENLLLETDAPYQYLKGETRTDFGEIIKVYKGAFELRKEENDFESFVLKIYNNAKQCYKFL